MLVGEGKEGAMWKEGYAPHSATGPWPGQKHHVGFLSCPPCYVWTATSAPLPKNAGQGTADINVHDDMTNYPVVLHQKGTGSASLVTQSSFGSDWQRVTRDNLSGPGWWALLKVWHNQEWWWGRFHFKTSCGAAYKLWCENLSLQLIDTE